jgi:uncharacterized protein
MSIDACVAGLPIAQRRDATPTTGLRMDQILRIFRMGAVVSLALAATGALVVAGAQVLSSPLGAPPPGARSAATSGAPAADGNVGLALGQGPGYHSPNSIFPPLSARDDVVPWSVLTAVKTKNEKNRILPVFSMGQMSLNQKTQRVQGFMMPLDPGATQKHFLLSSVPLTCPFCMPGGPESLVEVKTKTPVRYSMEPVVVEGRFLVLNDDAQGLYYRITDASSVR